LPPAPSEPRQVDSQAGARRRSWPWVTAAAGVVVLAIAIGGLVSWHFASKVLVPDHDPWPQDIAVKAVRPGRIVLERTEETSRPGYIGLAWQGGHATVGRVIAQGPETVTRHLGKVDGYLPAGQTVAIGRVYAGNPRQALGLPFSTAEIEGELGTMPAWRIPPAPTADATRGDAWAIFVHGINSSPADGLALAPLLRREGLTSLLITYREDLGAPASPDGYHHMGLTEWRDLEAAARYALAHGARRLVLIGYSMGGAIVARFMESSPLANRVQALILDAPALNWRKVLEFNATEMGLPGSLSQPVAWAIQARIDVDWKDLDAAAHLEDFRLPILLFHGTEDDVVPIGTSEEFAADLPRWVTFYKVPDAGHVQEWQVYPRLYEQRVSYFLGPALEYGQ
jgi:pimeloyl-ACP methyl ester carboxylesterase